MTQDEFNQMLRNAVDLDGVLDGEFDEIDGAAANTRRDVRALEDAMDRIENIVAAIEARRPDEEMFVRLDRFRDMLYDAYREQLNQLNYDAPHAAQAMPAPAVEWNQFVVAPTPFPRFGMDNINMDGDENGQP